jgi:hypothetical protein
VSTRSTRGEARLSPRALRTSGVVLAVALVGVVAVVVAQGWHAHQRSQRAATLRRAEAELLLLTLPNDVRLTPRTGSCSAAVDRLCATSSLDPTHVAAELSATLDGRVVKGPPYGAQASGQIAGYPAVAIAFEHVVDSRTTRPPPGAMPLGKSKVLFVYGSDVVIELRDG